MKLYSSKLDYKTWYLQNIIPKNEFYAVKYGIKPTSLRWIQKDQINSFAKVLEVFRSENIYFKLRENKECGMVCFYGLKPHFVEAYSKIYFGYNGFPETAWIMLWYPKCCILDSEKNGAENPKMAFKKTGSKYRLDYRVNSIFHYGWRWPVNEIYDVGKNDSEIITEAFSFIHHQPHSYECEKSLEYWKKLEKIIYENDRAYYDLITEKVQKVYLYYDAKNRIALENNFSWVQPVSIFEWILHDESLIKFFEEVKYIDLKEDLHSTYFGISKNEIQIPYKDDIIILNFKTQE